MHPTQAQILELGRGLMTSGCVDTPAHEGLAARKGRTQAMALAAWREFRPPVCQACLDEEEEGVVKEEGIQDDGWAGG